MKDPGTDSNYDDLLSKANDIKEEIIQQIIKSHDFDDFVLIDIPILLKNYLTQTEQLIWRYNKLNKVINNFSIDMIDSTIEELSKMLGQTDDATLKEKCETSITQYELHRKTLNDYSIQKDKVKKRLDSTLFSLLKVKSDLQKLSTMDSNKHRLEFYKNFQNSFRYDI